MYICLVSIYEYCLCMCYVTIYENCGEIVLTKHIERHRKLRIHACASINSLIHISYAGHCKHLHIFYIYASLVACRCTCIQAHMDTNSEGLSFLFMYACTSLTLHCQMTLYELQCKTYSNMKQVFAQ